MFNFFKRNNSGSEEKLQRLTRAFTEMLEIDDLVDVYAFIGKTLGSLCGNSFVFIASVDESRNIFQPVVLQGANLELLDKAKEIVGVHILENSCELLPWHYKLFKNDKLIRYDGEFEELAYPFFTVDVAKKIKDIGNISSIYIIGIVNKDKLLSVVEIYPVNGFRLTDINLIELFIRQAGLVIQKKIVEKELRDSEAHFSSLANMGQALIWTAGPDKKCNYFNKTWLEFTGRTIEEEYGDGWAEGVHPADLERCFQIYVSSFDDRRSFSMDYRLKRNDGQYRWIQDNGSPMYNAQNEFVGYIGHCLDITELKKSEETLLMFRLGIERSEEVIFMTDPNGFIIYANPRFERVYGFKMSEVLGRTPAILKSGIANETEYKLFWQNLKAGKTIKGEIINQGRNGNHINIDESISPIIGDNGALLGYLAIQRDITTRKQSEILINKLSKAIDQSPLSIIITDIVGEIEYVNPYFSILTGYSSEESIGQNPRFLNDGSDKKDFYLNLWNTITSGREWRGEFRNKKKSGEFYYESAVISPIFGDSGSVVNYVAVKEDITGRIKAEETLRESERILSEAQQLSQTGHFIIEIESGKWSCSPVVETILGIDSSVEKKLETWSSLVSSEFLAKVKGYQENTFDKNSLEFECKINRFSDKKERWIFIRGEFHLNNSGKPLRYIGTIQDITDRKKVEHEILLNNERLQSLLRIANNESDNVQELLDFALHEAINLTESKFGYIYLYDEKTKAFRLNSWSNEVHMNCRIVEPNTIYELDKTGCWGDVVRFRKPVMINDYSPKHARAKGTPDGHVELLKFLSVPVVVDHKIVAVVGVANKQEDYNNNDVVQLTITMDSVWKIVERQMITEELIAAKEKAVQSDNLKSAFLANMSHEIRTPMNAIMGFSELLAKSPLSHEAVVKYGDIIHSRSTYLLTLIDDILDLSKVEAGILAINTSHFRLNSVFDELALQYKYKLTSLKKDVKFVIEKERADELSYLNSDKNRIQQLLTNLTDNAIKFTSKGTITMSYKNDPDLGIIFSITDTGVGISAKDQLLIFERFHKSNDYVLNYGGLGLGLSICKGIVNILGGKIWVESEIGKGSSFKFSLPLKFENLNVAPNKPESKEKSVLPEIRKVLLVEDDPYNVELFQNILYQMDVIVAEDGHSALKNFRDNKDIVLVLMDIGLPDISGLEVTRIIRKMGFDVPILALTAYVSETDKLRFAEAGCDDFIPKPVDSQTLLKKVNEYLDLKTVKVLNQSQQL